MWNINWSFQDREDTSFKAYQHGGGREDRNPRTNPRCGPWIAACLKPRLYSADTWSRALYLMWFSHASGDTFLGSCSQLLIRKLSGTRLWTSAWNWAKAHLELQRNVWRATGFPKLISPLKTSISESQKDEHEAHGYSFICCNLHSSRVTMEPAWKTPRKETIWLAKLKPDLHLKNGAIAHLCANEMEKGCR